MPASARAFTALVAVALLAAMAGCAPAQSRHTPSATPAAASSSSAPVTTSGHALPGGPFADGDCNRVLDSTTLQATLGETHPAIATTEDFELAIVGGIGCHYQLGAAGAKRFAEVRVDVAPRAIADPAEITASIAPPSCGPQSEDVGAAPCTATGAVGGWWYNLFGFTTNQKSKAQLAHFTAVAASLERSLTAVAAPQQVPIVAPFNCESDFLPEDASDYLSNAEFPAEVLVADNLLERGTVNCTPSGDDSDWELAVYPGAGESYAQCTHRGIGGGSSVSVPGVRSAFAVSGDSEQTPTICATDGSTVIVAGDDARLDGPEADRSPWTPDELTSLGSLLVPVFEAGVPKTSDWRPSLPEASAGQTVTPVVGGDCNKLVQTKAAAAAMHASAHAKVVVVDPLLATVGGTECNFVFPRLHGGKVFDFEAEVAPTGMVDPTELNQTLASADCGVDPSNEDEDSELCTETAVVAGWWYHLTLTDTAGSDDDDTPLLASLSTLLEHTLSATAAPASVAVRKPFACPTADAVGSPVTSSRLMPDLYELDFNDSRSFGGLDPIHAAAFLMAGPSTCTIAVGPVDEWVATLYPGSASAYFACTHGAYGKSTAAPGLNLGFTFAHLGQEVCATDGTSTISVAELQDEDMHPWTTAELKTLGKVLQPMFAAATH